MTTVMGHCPKCGSYNTSVNSGGFAYCYSCRFTANPRAADFTLKDIKRIVNEVLDEREARGK